MRDIDRIVDEHFDKVKADANRFFTRIIVWCLAISVLTFAACGVLILMGTK